MHTEISRRGFLKSLSALSFTLLFGNHLYAHQKVNRVEQNQDVPNVLIVVFDALSAKNMSLYGYDRGTTPNLERCSEKATVYHRHYAGGNFTSPGTASLLTGTYPWSHRVFQIGARVVKSHSDRNLFKVFDEKTFDRIAYTHNRFANHLLTQFGQDLDIHIPPDELCIFDGRFSTQPFAEDEYIADQAVEDFLFAEYKVPGSLFLSEIDRVGQRIIRKAVTREYADRFPLGIPHIHGRMDFVLEDAIDRIIDVAKGSTRPFLGYFHLYPPHYPYHTRREFVGHFDDGWEAVPKPLHHFTAGFPDEHLNELRRQYDEFILYADAEFGRLYDTLSRAGRLENTYLVVTSDHGELFERGAWEHVTPLLYEPLIHVPLLVFKPGQQRRQDVYTPTSCVDLMPTLLNVTGQAAPDWCEGEVLPTFDGYQESTGRSVYAVEAKMNPQRGPLTTATVALLKDRFKLIHYLGYDGFENEYELYDVVNDPEEMEDLYSPDDPITAMLKNELAETLQTVNAPYAG